METPARSVVLGEFPGPSPLLEAVRTLRQEGFTELDTHSPFPLHGAEEALGLRPSRVPWMAFGAGLTGAALGYFMQWGFNASLYPLNVGNRLAHSPLANIPITFELTILFTALALFFGLVLVFFRLPRPYHPVFEVEAFRSATTHGYWVSVELPRGDVPGTRRVRELLEGLGGVNVAVVEETP
jgi:hypothetical protein